ncbi:Clp protease N-terminal domain-containing protein [Ktedonosporobacter rubrisoli]|nr:Clp protease N-terminal domain-containing protein [Ktedonosporobacter rubrisoli]
MSDSLTSYSLEQLDPATQAVLAQAEIEARAFEHNYIGTEHLLLALLASQENFGTRVLQTLGVSYSRAQKALEHIDRQHAQKGEPPTEQPIGLTSRAVAAVTLARSETNGMRLPLITPELLLIGIIREGEGIGAGILRSLGADLEKVRAQIYAHLVRAGKASDVSPVKGNVITCRINDQDLAAIDALVEAGVRTTRSEAAAWLIHVGIDANKALFDTVYGTVAEIRRLRVIAQSLAQDVTSSSSEEKG